MAATAAKRQPNRWPALLDAAAAQFAERGYHATSMRDLAAAIAMTPGAIYFHVASKQALLLAVYEEGVQRILDRVEAAVAAEREPWARLEKAVAAHLESILDASAYARVLIRILPTDAPEISAELKELRDRYEARLGRYFSAITLPRERDADDRAPRLARRHELDAGLVQGRRQVGAGDRARIFGAAARARRRQILARPQMTASKFRPPARVLVTKIGLDGHDRGSRIVAAYLRDAGMEVIYTPPWQSIAAVVKLAMEEDVDVIGVSSLATDHLIVPKLMEALRAAGLGHIGLLVGGIVPEDERPALIEAGVSAIFGPGSARDEIIEHVATLAAKVREIKNAELREIAQ